MAYSRSLSIQRIGIPLGPDYTIGPRGLTHLPPWSCQSPVLPNQTVSYVDCSFAMHLPQPISCPLLSISAGFPHPTTRPFFPTNLWLAVHSAVDLPVSSIYLNTVSINPSNWPHFHCAANLTPATYFPSATGRPSFGKAVKGVALASGFQNQMLQPRFVVWPAQHFRIGREGRKQTIPKRKDYMITVGSNKYP